MIIMLSGKARSGKDTFYRFINDPGFKFKRYAFADRLKEIATLLFNWDGEKDEVGRFMLISIGQIMRGESKKLIKKYIGDRFKLENIIKYKKVLEQHFSFNRDCWVDNIAHSIARELKSGENAVITDWRFKSEYYRLVMLYGYRNIITVRINRNEVLQIDDLSETELDDFTFNYYLYNNSTLGDYFDEVNLFINKHF